MQTIKTIQEMQQQADALRATGKTIGFVPTMGYLHDGHLSLVKIARKNSDVVVLSIFVNPTQFGPNEDFDKYPRDFKKDEQLAKDAGVGIIFYPAKEEMYPETFLTWVQVEEMTNRLCGASRPGHFKGVTTICTKLFLAVKPHVAVFGQKDAQQAAVIEKMVDDLNFGFEIIIAPIIREPDGLAMSSRNTYLSTEEREQALVLSESLKQAENRIQNGEKDPVVILKILHDMITAKPLSKIDYIEIVSYPGLKSIKKLEGKILIALAVFFGHTRLIDNVILEV